MGRTLPCAAIACALGVANWALGVDEAQWSVRFVDIAARAGLTHPSLYGGVDRKRFIIETNGAGVALIDYDRGGWLDALVLSGTRLADAERLKPSGA